VIRETTGRFWRVLGISLALHAALLVSLRDHLPEIHFAEPSPSLSVAIEAIEIAEQPPARQERPARTSRQPARPKPEPEPLTRQPALASEASPPQPIPPIETPSPSRPVESAQSLETAEQSAPPALDRAQIVQRLREELRAHFTYPPLARRRNIEGRVTLGFGIDGSGTIRDVRVLRSSGHAILDLAAERTLRRLHRVKWYPAISGGRSTEIELPVVYRLTSSRGT